MKKLKSVYAVDFLIWLVGSAIYAAAVTVFLTPNEISPGGFTGIATVLNFVTGVSAGTILFLLNIPLLILQYIKFGGGFVVKTTAATFLVSFSLNITEILLPKLIIDGVLVSLFGGILSGLGLSLVFLRGATTGGVDVIAKLINMKYKHISVGRVILFADFSVVIINALVHRNIESALYSLISIYASTKIIDSILYGADKGKMVLVITDKGEQITNLIFEKLYRGVTVLNGHGAYTKKQKNVLLCAVRIHEVSSLHKIILSTDKNAFVLVADVGEILGEGFKIS